jgi:hypothetical protein
MPSEGLLLNYVRSSGRLPPRVPRNLGGFGGAAR